MVVDKIVAGMISSLVLSPDDLPEGVNEILLGPKTHDVISSKLTLAHLSKYQNRVHHRDLSQSQ